MCEKLFGQNETMGKGYRTECSTTTITIKEYTRTKETETIAVAAATEAVAAATEENKQRESHASKKWARAIFPLFYNIQNKQAEMRVVAKNITCIIRNNNGIVI